MESRTSPESVLGLKTRPIGHKPHLTMAAVPTIRPKSPLSSRAPSELKCLHGSCNRRETEFKLAILLL